MTLVKDKLEALKPILQELIALGLSKKAIEILDASFNKDKKLHDEGLQFIAEELFKQREVTLAFSVADCISDHPTKFLLIQKLNEESFRLIKELIGKADFKGAKEIADHLPTFKDPIFNDIYVEPKKKITNQEIFKYLAENYSAKGMHDKAIQVAELMKDETARSHITNTSKKLICDAITLAHREGKTSQAVMFIKQLSSVKTLNPPEVDKYILIVTDLFQKGMVNEAYEVLDTIQDKAIKDNVLRNVAMELINQKNPNPETAMHVVNLIVNETTKTDTYRVLASKFPQVKE